MWRNELPSSKTIDFELLKCDIINIIFARKEIAVNCFIESTMINRKIQTNFSTMTNSKQCCPACGLSPKTMNNGWVGESFDGECFEFRHILDNLEFKHGLSSQHAWINCFELLLYIGYKKATRKRQARAVADKTAVQQVKSEI